MALKPTIYRVQVQLADSDRGCYDDLTLTLARHPSETLERMTARLLAYCRHSGPRLEFTRGLSTAEEPDLWQVDHSGDIQQWIEVGQPEESRLRKACGRAREVSVYAFGKSATTWWQQQGEAIAALPRLRAWQFDWQEIGALAARIERNARLSVSIAGGVMYVDCAGATCSLEPRLLAGDDQLRF